jgi:hypothetical protein
MNSYLVGDVCNKVEDIVIFGGNSLVVVTHEWLGTGKVVVRHTQGIHAANRFTAHLSVSQGARGRYV